MTKFLMMTQPTSKDLSRRSSRTSWDMMMMMIIIIHPSRGITGWPHMSYLHPKKIGEWPREERGNLTPLLIVKPIKDPRFPSCCFCFCSIKRLSIACTHPTGYETRDKDKLNSVSAAFSWTDPNPNPISIRLILPIPPAKVPRLTSSRRWTSNCSFRCMSSESSLYFSISSLVCLIFFLSTSKMLDPCTAVILAIDTDGDR